MVVTTGNGTLATDATVYFSYDGSVWFAGLDPVASVVSGGGSYQGLGVCFYHSVQKCFFFMQSASGSMQTQFMGRRTDSPLDWNGGGCGGMYRPTLTNTTNVAASVAEVALWSKNGNIVTVCGQMTVDPTTTGLNTVVGISLPIPSSLNGNAVAGLLSGVGSCPTVTHVAAITGDATNQRATFRFLAASASNVVWQYIFMYPVV